MGSVLYERLKIKIESTYFSLAEVSGPRSVQAEFFSTQVGYSDTHSALYDLTTLPYSI